MFIIVSHSIIITHIQIMLCQYHHSTAPYTLVGDIMVALELKIFQGPGDQISCEPDWLRFGWWNYLLSSEETSLTLWTSSECIFMQVEVEGGGGSTLKASLPQIDLRTPHFATRFLKKSCHHSVSLLQQTWFITIGSQSTWNLLCKF